MTNITEILQEYLAEYQNNSMKKYKRFVPVVYEIISKMTVGSFDFKNCQRNELDAFFDVCRYATQNIEFAERSYKLNKRLSEDKPKYYQYKPELFQHYHEMVDRYMPILEKQSELISMGYGNER